MASTGAETQALVAAGGEGLWWTAVKQQLRAEAAEGPPVDGGAEVVVVGQARATTNSLRPEGRVTGAVPA
jgi:hypothetical protein